MGKHGLEIIDFNVNACFLNLSHYNYLSLIGALFE